MLKLLALLLLVGMASASGISENDMKVNTTLILLIFDPYINVTDGNFLSVAEVDGVKYAGNLSSMYIIDKNETFKWCLTTGPIKES